MSVTLYKSPFGILRLEDDGEAITGLFFTDDESGEAVAAQGEKSEILKKCIAQLDEYFEGKRTVFELKLKYTGTEFQMLVWNALQNIGYGESVSYRDVAKAIGKPAAVRAVGSANHRNNISIIIPCHRVIGADGKLTGYGGGLWRKEWLLEHERKHHMETRDLQ